jgi:hypothetical protein
MSKKIMPKILFLRWKFMKDYKKEISFAISKTSFRIIYVWFQKILDSKKIMLLRFSETRTQYFWNEMNFILFFRPNDYKSSSFLFLTRHLLANSEDRENFIHLSKYNFHAVLYMPMPFKYFTHCDVGRVCPIACCKISCQNRIRTHTFYDSIVVTAVMECVQRQGIPRYTPPVKHIFMTMLLNKFWHLCSTQPTIFI